LIFSNTRRHRKPSGKPIPPFFLTLTFSENITDVRIANRLFSKFIQRFNYELFDCKEKKLAYVAVPQFQERGAVHYHVCVFNLPYIHGSAGESVYSLIRRVWRQGTFINLKKINSDFGIYNYIRRYMQKNFDDSRLLRKRKFFYSSACLQPLEVRTDSSIEWLSQICDLHCEQKKNFCFEMPFLGEVKKTIYCMPKDWSFDRIKLSTALRRELGYTDEKSKIIKKSITTSPVAKR